MRKESEGGRAAAIRFGPFRLLPERKLLLNGGEPVRVGARSMALLLALVERAGELLSREELEARAWPTSVLEATSLRVHMSALRRSLQDGADGARYIANVPGRGYCFVAQITSEAAAAPAPAEAADADAADAVADAAQLARRVAAVALPEMDGSAWVITGHVPSRLMSIVGREANVAALTQQIDQGRLVTLLGPGGIGKTTVALVVANRARASRPVCFLDLTLVGDAERVPAAVAAAFGLADFPDDPLGAVARMLGSRRVLLVLDNCEHVIDAVAALASALLARSPGLHLLTTSREAIGMDLECLHRLPALHLPAAAYRPNAAEALACSAVQLFVERASANLDSFRLSDEDAPVLADLCRRLGGIPLAIEVAAARLGQFGLRGLLAQVDAGFLHLRRGRRTGVSRHEALSAMLDWSHRLLSDAEQAILRRISVFRSPFTLRSAIRVAADEGLSESDVVNGLAGLRSKSLLNRVVLGDVVKHQMLEHTRAYALERLAESGDEDAVRRRHALLVGDLLAEAQRNWPLMPKRQWMTLHASLLPAIHTALQWAFSPTGDALIGATLTSISWPMARYLFMEDYEASLRRAIEALSLMNAPPLMLQVRLQLGMATHLQERLGTGAETRAAYDQAVELAKASMEPVHQIEALIGQVRDAMGSQDAPRAVAIASRIKALAQACSDEVSCVVADRLAAQALHMDGQHATAHRLALAVRSHAVQRGPLASLAGVVDHRVSMDILLARSLWLEGCADQASLRARGALKLAEMDSTLALCQALALAVCPIALWRGDNNEAQIHAAILLTQALRLGSGQWLSLAQGYMSIIEARRMAASKRPYRRPLDSPAAPIFPFARDQLVAIDGSLWSEESLARADEGRVGWCAPELWRLQGLSLLAEGSPRAAEAALLQSLELAGRQGALAWSLRSATSLARLWRAEGRAAQAREVLGAVHGKLGEGLRTTDAVAATQLLDELRLHEQQALP